jgi:multidrug efflux pump
MWVRTVLVTTLMRLWLDPNKLASRGLTATEVIDALREQNVQVSAGELGTEPSPNVRDAAKG